jgi:hypothetical protein
MYLILFSSQVLSFNSPWTALNRYHLTLQEIQDIGEPSQSVIPSFKGPIYTQQSDIGVLALQVTKNQGSLSLFPQR